MNLVAVIALAVLATGPALAADYAAGASGGYADASGYEVRKYYMDTGGAYGDPTSDYAVITPAPPNRFIYIQGARGPARVEIDDRPPFPGPDYIPLVK